MKNKILIITETHGNEKIGTEIMQKIKPAVTFDWIVGNKKASKVNKRFIKFNMNRIAPGNSKSKNYEEKRVAKIVLISKKYKSVIDIHGTNSESVIYIIITESKIENILLALSLPIQNIVIWDSKNDRSGPITKFVKCGVEIECGSQNSTKTKKELLKIIKIISEKGIDFSKINFSQKNIFRVYGKLPANKRTEKLKLIDFNKTSLNKEVFFPLLSRRYTNIACHKMRKVNFTNLLSY